MSVEFTNNCMKVSEALTSAITAFLYEIGGEIQSQVRRNSRVDTGQTKGSYEYAVDEGSKESSVEVGSSYENAIWEEFGTGEYALHGDGRKGGWTYCDSRGNYHFTHGKKPNQPLTRAFQSTSPKIEARLQQIVKENVGD